MTSITDKLDTIQQITPPGVQGPLKTVKIMTRPSPFENYTKRDFIDNQTSLPKQRLRRPLEGLRTSTKQLEMDFVTCLRHAESIKGHEDVVKDFTNRRSDLKGSDGSRTSTTSLNEHAPFCRRRERATRRLSSYKEEHQGLRDNKDPHIRRAQ